MKKNYIYIGIAGLVAIIILAVRFIFGGDEDTWICNNGEWVKHGNPMIAKPNKGCGDELDDVIKILIGLKEATDGDFSQIANKAFEWRIEGEKTATVIKTEKLKINGKGIASDELNREQVSSITLFFNENGFSKSLYNIFPGYQDTVGGYQKGDVVCLVEQFEQKDEKTKEGMRFNISCGELSETEIADDNSEIANPAAVYCIDQGGSLRYEEVEAGTRGICVFQDGSECEEWEYYRGECP